MKTLYWKDWSKNKNFFFLIHMYVRGIRFYLSKFSNSNYPILQSCWNLCSKICWIHSFLHIFRKMNFFSILFFLFGSQYISIIPITAVFFEQFFFFAFPPRLSANQVRTFTTLANGSIWWKIFTKIFLAVSKTFPSTAMCIKSW